MHRQTLFEKSKFNLIEAPMSTKYMAYNEHGINRWLFTDCVGPSAYFFRLYVVFMRTMHVKFRYIPNFKLYVENTCGAYCLLTLFAREYHVLMKSLLINIFLPVLIGSLMYGQGDFGDQINQEGCIAFEVPYPNPYVPGTYTYVPVGPYCVFPSFKVMNISGCMFLSITLTGAPLLLTSCIAYSPHFTAIYLERLLPPVTHPPDPFFLQQLHKQF